MLRSTQTGQLQGSYFDNVSKLSLSTMAGTLSDETASSLKFIMRDSSESGALDIASVTLPRDSLENLLENSTLKGFATERIAELSVSKDATVECFSRVGIRIHGGQRRREQASAGEDYSLRIYFRNPISRRSVSFLGWKASDESFPSIYVLRKTNGFTNYVASLVSSHFDVLQPSQKLCFLYVNGCPKGIYEACARPNIQFVEKALGLPVETVFKFGSVNTSDAKKAYKELHRWVDESGDVMTIADAKRRVDIDAFCGHLLSLMFCSTEDNRQGCAVRVQGVWRWINWDSDESFGSSFSSRFRSAPLGVALFAGDAQAYDSESSWVPRELRAKIFVCLSRNCQEFRQRFIQLAKTKLSSPIKVNENVGTKLSALDEHRLLLPPEQDKRYELTLSFIADRHRELLSEINRFMRNEASDD